MVGFGVSGVCWLGAVVAPRAEVTAALTNSVGSLLGGAVAASAGPTAVIASAGVDFLFVVAYVAAVPAVRRLPAVSEAKASTA